MNPMQSPGLLYVYHYVVEECTNGITLGLPVHELLAHALLPRQAELRVQVARRKCVASQSHRPVR
jgi:hypothetical protein